MQIDPKGLGAAKSEGYALGVHEGRVELIVTAYLSAVSHEEPAGDIQPVEWRDETDAEHIARDIKEGRFPRRSERQKRPAVDDAWERIRSDGELDGARRKLSMHELRRIIKHAVAAHTELSAVSPPDNVAAGPTSLDCGGWQPIETAPKDGTRVDLWQKGRFTDAFWDEGEEWWCIDSLYSDGEPCPLAVSPEPTHWRPLPAPPKAGE